MSFESPSSANGAWPRLCVLPMALKISLNGFLILALVGLVVSHAQHLFSHAEADGLLGLTYEDLRIAMRGELPLGPDTSPTASEMWEQIHGGMRSEFRDQTDFEILAAWLSDGATEVTYDWPWTARGGAARPLPAAEVAGDQRSAERIEFARTPAQIVRDSCVSCHGPEGERAVSPLNTFAAVRVWIDPPEQPQPNRQPSTAQRTQGMHARLLALPLVILLFATVFHWAEWPSGSRAGRAVLTLLPMLALILDVTFTLAARMADLAVAPALMSRGLFVLSLLLQTIGVVGGLWASPSKSAKT